MSEVQKFLQDLWDSLVDFSDRAEHLGVIGTIENLLNLDEHAIELAYTVLLVNLAEIDNDYAPREGYFIKQELKKHLGVTYEEAVNLVAKARKITDGDKELKKFGVYLQHHLSEEKRKELLDVMDRLVGEDNFIHPFEKALQAKYRRLLGFEGKE